MRIFIAVLILIFNIQSLSKADDIKDFEIEGMSIGDSALDFFTESEILKNRQNYYNDNEFVPVFISGKFDNYDGFQFHYKSSDKNFKIFALEGTIWIRNNFDDCKKKQKNIDKEFKVAFSNTKRSSTGIESHPEDNSGKSKYKAIFYDFKSEDHISIICYDWTEKMKYPDNLRIGIMTKEFQTWINDKAYN